MASTAGPALVIGMGGKVADLACRLFTRQFYQSLLRGDPTWSAAAGRRGAFTHGFDPLDTVDWATPVVFIEASATLVVDDVELEAARKRESAARQFRRQADPPGVLRTAALLRSMARGHDAAAARHATPARHRDERHRHREAARRVTAPRGTRRRGHPRRARALSARSTARHRRSGPPTSPASSARSSRRRCRRACISACRRTRCRRRCSSSRSRSRAAPPTCTRLWTTPSRSMRPKGSARPCRWICGSLRDEVVAQLGAPGGRPGAVRSPSSSSTKCSVMPAQPAASSSISCEPAVSAPSRIPIPVAFTYRKDLNYAEPYEQVRKALDAVSNWAIREELQPLREAGQRPVDLPAPAAASRATAGVLAEPRAARRRSVLQLDPPRHRRRLSRRSSARRPSRSTTCSSPCRT